MKDVHTEHCCKRHGCKYGNEDCPVENGILPQSYLCESCHWDGAKSLEELEYLDTDMWNLKKVFDDLGINYVIMESGPQYENDPLLHHLLFLLY